MQALRFKQDAKSARKLEQFRVYDFGPSAMAGAIISTDRSVQNFSWAGITDRVIPPYSKARHDQLLKPPQIPKNPRRITKYQIPLSQKYNNLYHPNIMSGCSPCKCSSSDSSNSSSFSWSSESDSCCDSSSFSNSSSFSFTSSGSDSARNNYSTSFSTSSSFYDC